MNGWCGVLLLTKDEDIISMHRDNISTIRDPDCYGIFGGEIEDGETPLQAAVREITEETNIKVSAGSFAVFKVYEQQRDYLPAPTKLHVFLLRNINPSTLEVFEGQGIKVLKDALEPKIAQDIKVTFEDWFAHKKSTRI